MPPTLLSSILAPAWNALTAEQRTCWHFWALAHPQTSEQGVLRTNYGNQEHTARNANIAVADGPALITDPPTTQPDPPFVTVIVIAWPLQSKLQGAEIARRGVIALEFPNPLPANITAIVTQGYTQKHSGKGRQPRIRHVTRKLPGTDGVLRLDIASGYFAETSGDTKYARIKGISARRRPDLPIAKLKIIDVETGKRARQAIANIYGGGPTKINRPRATAVNPTTGTNHYP